MTTRPYFLSDGKGKTCDYKGTRYEGQDKNDDLLQINRINYDFVGTFLDALVYHFLLFISIASL